MPDNNEQSTKTLLGYPIKYVDFAPSEFPENLELGDFSSYLQFELRKKKED